MSEERCKLCGRLLTGDEIAVYKRMVSRAAERFLCVSCFAKKFGVSEALVYEKIEHFRAMGCTLFAGSGQGTGNSGVSRT